MNARRFAAGIVAWGFAFGCVIGWGSFVMPGTTFLPNAGPVGSLFGIVAAALLICLIALNYSYLAREVQGGSGSYYFVKSTLDNDHAFLSAWSLALAYVSLLWANATAFALIGRYLLGTAFQWGFHYQLFGYDVYFGEVLMTMAVLVVFGLVSCYARRFAEVLRTVLAIGLAVSVAALFIACVPQASAFATTPPFASGGAEGMQVMSIVIMAPWMFVGFEVVFHSAAGGRLSHKGVFAAALGAIIAGCAVYVALTFVGASGAPEGFASWNAYVAALGTLDGSDAMPVLYNAQSALGQGGVVLVGVAVLCALSTSMLGFYRAAARLVVIMGEDGLLPKPLAKVDGGMPRNAILSIMCVSLFVPFLGRTAVGWNADVSTLSVAIVYAYVAFCAYKRASENSNRPHQALGVIGIVVSALIFFFLLVPNVFMDSALATESYFMLAVWSLAGIICYWVAFRRDSENRLGKSTAMWVAMMFLLLFSVNVWARLFAQGQLQGYVADGAPLASSLMISSVAMLAVIVVALLLMRSLFATMLHRQKELSLKVIQADERARAKTSFLSNMSHDIRTPMNAIVGFTNLAMQSADDEEKTREYLRKIEVSSDHLLSLINDVLEMSRIESGKIDLEEREVSLPEVLHDMNTIVVGQALSKGVALSMYSTDVRNEDVWCDRLRLNQVLLNLLSNAVKYTPSGGSVSVCLAQVGDAQDGFAPYEIHVKDNGIGMTQEFAEKVFEAFEREKSEMVDGIQGTGLGMAITKRIVDLMGGTIEVDTELGRGSEFIVKVRLRVQEEKPVEQLPECLESASVLVVGGAVEERESICAMLEEIGLRVVWTPLATDEAQRSVLEGMQGEPFFAYVVIDGATHGESGIETARVINRTLGETEGPGSGPARVVLVSALDWVAVKDDISDAGVSEFCSKPLFPSELRRVLINLVEGADAAVQASEPSPDEASYAGKRLLLVDDIDLNREIATAVLEIYGFKVEEACDGQEAVEKVAASAPGYYDAVLMDINMPIMNGYDAARAIRALDDPALARVPILAVTANAFDEDKKMAVEAGMNGHVPKPIDGDKLVQTLDEVLSR